MDPRQPQARQAAPVRGTSRRDGPPVLAGRGLAGALEDGGGGRPGGRSAGRVTVRRTQNEQKRDTVHASGQASPGLPRLPPYWCVGTTDTGRCVTPQAVESVPRRASCLNQAPHRPRWSPAIASPTSHIAVAPRHSRRPRGPLGWIRSSGRWGLLLQRGGDRVHRDVGRRVRQGAGQTRPRRHGPVRRGPHDRHRGPSEPAARPLPGESVAVEHSTSTMGESTRSGRPPLSGDLVSCGAGQPHSPSAARQSDGWMSAAPDPPRPKGR